MGTNPDTGPDYRYVDDDFRRSIAINNLQTVEREHASVALALDALNMLVAASSDPDVKASYQTQANDQTKRLASLNEQMTVWDEILDSIPSIVATEAPDMETTTGAQ